MVLSRQVGTLETMTTAEPCKATSMPVSYYKIWLTALNFLVTMNSLAKNLVSLDFCWGGYATNFIAAQLGDKVTAGVPFYGRGVTAEEASNIKAALLIQSPEHDERINAAWPDFEAATEC